MIPIDQIVYIAQRPLFNKLHFSSYQSLTFMVTNIIAKTGIIHLANIILLKAGVSRKNKQGKLYNGRVLNVSNPIDTKKPIAITVNMTTIIFYNISLFLIQFLNNDFINMILYIKENIT